MYSSPYEELLANSIESTIHITSIRVIAFEVYKTPNNLNPIFMKDYLLQKTTSRNLRIHIPLLIPKVKTTNYGIKSLSFQGPKIWNPLPDEIKTAQNTKLLFLFLFYFHVILLLYFIFFDVVILYCI